MKTIIQRMALVAFGAVALVAGASHAAEAKGGPKTTVIKLDGFCSVVTLTVFAWHQVGERSADCDGSTGLGSGMEGIVTGVSPKDITFGETYSGNTNATYLWNIQYPLATGNSWSIFSSPDGATYTYVSGGTYTITGLAQGEHALGQPALRKEPSAHRPGPQ